MRLMRHTSLVTTTKYMRTVVERMRQAVENLGAIQWPQKGLKRHNWPSWESFVSWQNCSNTKNFSRESLVAVSGVEPPTPRIWAAWTNPKLIDLIDLFLLGETVGGKNSQK